MAHIHYLIKASPTLIVGISRLKFAALLSLLNNLTSTLTSRLFKRHWWTHLWRLKWRSNKNKTSAHSNFLKIYCHLCSPSKAGMLRPSCKVHFGNCYFGKLDAIVKLQLGLLYSYCSSLYGSELWDLSFSTIVVLCFSWRRALKNVWKLPSNTHGDLMYALSCVRPIEVELKCTVLNFVLNCLNSDVGLVRSVTRHVISSLGCQSPIGKNLVSCCQLLVYQQ